MAKLLVVGMGPLFDKGVRRFGAQCLRTWYFTKPLLDDGHTVRLITLPIYDPDDARQQNAALVRRVHDDFEYQAFTNCDFAFIDRTLTDLTRSFGPDGIVAVNLLPSWVAARLRVCTPLWADLNGYEMAEKQGQAARIGDDAPLFDAWNRESIVARRADKLSTVSRPQLHALLGEMAGLGRLNRHTFHYQFAHHVPEAAHPAFAFLGEDDPNAEAFLRGKVVPQNAFVMLWSGGYNYWTDPQVLFDFIETVMASTTHVHYVSTGGSIAGYDEETYPAFCRLVERSAYRKRYHLLGWLPADDLLAVYEEADLGLSIDETNYETFFGARNRINNLMVAGLPVLTTYGSEISREIAEARCGLVCESGNVREMARQALRMVEDPGECRILGKRARAYAIENFAAENLTAPVRQWAQNPKPAPDNAEKLRREPGLVSFREASINRLEAVAAVVEEADILSLRQDQIDLNAIRSMAWYRTLKSVKDSYLHRRGQLRRFAAFCRDPSGWLRKKREAPKQKDEPKAKTEEPPRQTKPKNRPKKKKKRR